MSLPVHTQIEGFEVTDGCLCIAGRKLTELATEFGPTPFYVYDKALITRRIERLRAALPDEVGLHYAVKANPMPRLLNTIAPLVDGLDIASSGELRAAIASGTDATDISFAGPGKSPAELRDAVAAGVTVTLESLNEMQRVVAIGKKLDVVPRVAVRVNPNFELKSSGMQMSGGPKQFGIDTEQIPAVLNQIRNHDLEFVGLHIFCGSQSLNNQAIIEAQSKTVELAIELAQQAPTELSFINIGGGFGIPYFPGDRPIDIERIGKSLHRQVARVRKALGTSVQLVLELGRYIVGEAGVYVCRVLDRKVSRGHIFLITDGGLHHHLAASGNFGQVLRKNFPLVIGNKVSSDATERQMVVGPLCTPLDVLGASMELPPGEVDDLIVVFQSGAYGYTASPHLFLSHPPPQEILL